MNNLKSFRKTTVALLTILLIISIAAPLVSFASAAPAASLSKTSGPNGTVIGVSGSGFGVSEAVGAISVSVDGHTAGLNVITTTLAANPGVNPLTTISTSSQLATNSTGGLSGSIILYGLAVGAHTIIISDATTSVIAGTFTITTPTVVVTPSTVAAGTSVVVNGSAFPSSTFYTNVLTGASFAGTAITVVAGSTTANSAQLSSNVLTSGASYGTVSLPAITTGSAFTLTDAWNNVATTTLSLGATTVILSPSSGPVGTVVTATVAGFGPTTAIASVAVGNVVGTTSAATFSTAPVSETGTSVFVFTMPAGDATTLAGVAGAQTVTVTDSKGNTATATFTVTPKVMLSLGASGVNSQTTYAPASTASAQIFVAASGFKATSQITLSASPFIPTAWTIPTATWTVTTGTYSATTGKVSTDANGAVAFTSDMATTPAAAGQYSITISDGTTSVSTIITITTTGNILATNVAAQTTGAIGSTVTVAYFGAAAPATILFDSSVVATPAGAAQTWPLVSTNTVTLTVPATASGLHQITSSTTGFNSVAYTVLAPTITVVNPSSAAVGTTVSVVGTGFATTPAVVAIQGATVAAATSSLIGNTLVATFVVPNYIPGSYTLTLSDTINTAATTFNVAAAQIQITPTSSTLGTVKIAITGSGFAAGETFAVLFDAIDITAATPVGLSVINTNGGILINSGHAIPTATTAGAHTITVVGSHGSWATATFTVIPKLTALNAVRPGASVAITGTGFAGNSLQTLTVNGTATAWLNVGVVPAAALPAGTTVVTGANGNLMTSTTVGFTVAETTPAGVLIIVVTDASGNSATTSLTVLGTPAITLGASSIVAGNIPTAVTIAGSGFTPGSRAITANLYNGATLVTAITLTGSPVTVDATGVFKTTAGVTFKVPASVLAGTYTLRVTATSPTETANATLTVMGTPSMVAPTTARSSSNVTITVTGLSAISTATLSGVDLIGTSAFGPTTISASGASAFTKATWFIVPADLFAGTYLLTITDANTNLMVQSAITITPSVDVTPVTGSKGAIITVTGTGFAALSAVTAKVNNLAVTLSATTTSAIGALSATFAIPLTAIATNTLTITDAAGNAANATFALTVPQITLTPTTASVGNTVQIIGMGFKASSPIVITIGGNVVPTVPIALATGSDGLFIGYVAVPAGLSGNVTVNAIDTSNNAATEILLVGTTSPFTFSQAAMSSSAQTLNGAGQVATNFASGSTVKVSFVLQSLSGSGNVVTGVTFQQGAKVYNLASAPATISTTPSTVSFTNLLPASATGTWTATLQVYASDGVTPLGVTTLTFTVS